MFSLDLLKSKLSRTQILLYLKEKLLLMILRSHQYGTNINKFNNQFKITKIQEIMIYIIQIFDIMFRTHLCFEVRKFILINLITFNQNNVTLLYTTMHKQREELVHS